MISLKALREAKTIIEDFGRPIEASILDRLRVQVRRRLPAPAGQPDPLLNDPDRLEYHLWNEYWRSGSFKAGSIPKELGEYYRNGIFYGKFGEGIVEELGKEIGSLRHEVDKSWREIIGMGGYYAVPWGLADMPLDDFVLGSIPKLRADPIMLLLRVLYKMFRIGSGKRAANSAIQKIILDLKADQAGTLHESIFNSISDQTNFETLRKKTYWKGKDPIYDKLADQILAASLGADP